jgi:ABC-type uncharacterized transport system involved in gliding motility auxiliary subunit
MVNSGFVRVATAGVGITLALILVVMINWLGARHYLRGDWTRARIYSLSEKSLSVVRGLENEVDIVVFMTPASPMYTETRELLARYQAASSRVRVEYIDPDREPVRTRSLAQEFGVTVANTVVFTAGDRKKYVTADQLVEYDYSGMQFGQPPQVKAFRGEEQFTAAILAVDDPHQHTLCFSSGHGERPLAGFGQDGLSEFREMLTRDNLLTEEVVLVGGEVPAHCDLLVVAGPTARFAEPELEAVRTYLNAGGGALVMLDPILGGQQTPSGLEGLLPEFGIQVGDDLVLDPAQRLAVSMAVVYASSFRSHPITDAMQGLAVVFPVARSVATTAAGDVATSLLITTTESGWGEWDVAGVVAGRQPVRGDADTPGPVPLAAAARSEKEGGFRLVVIGDSDFVTNSWLPNFGNLNLALNAVNWLVERDRVLGIAPRQPEQVQLTLSAAQERNIVALSLLGLPAACVALGVFVWWRRRR